jgi:hypothetical protein
MPTILDSALGLAGGDWLDLDEDDVELLYASRKQAQPAPIGTDASISRARPE